jgi:AraC-like DNA-binding protein
MVAEPGGTCTVVRAVERQARWRLVDVRTDEPGAEEGVVRATVGLVRVADPAAGPLAGATRPGRERYRLVVRMDAGESGPRAITVELDVLTTTAAERPADRADALPDVRHGDLVRRIHAYINSHLGDPGLSPAVVAAAHHISLRYLHKLFEPEPRGVAGLIRQRRLERCRGELLDPARADRPVAGIAARWGFSSAAHFSRVFRDAYGMPPGEFRRAYSSPPTLSPSTSPSTSGNATNRTRKRRALAAGGSVAAA